MEEDTRDCGSPGRGLLEDEEAFWQPEAEKEGPPKFMSAAMTLTDFGSIVAKRLYFSSVIPVVYSFVLIINFFVLYRGIFGREVDFLLVFAECFVTFMFLGEILLRFATMGFQDFFKQGVNIFDAMVCYCCVMLLFVSGDLWRQTKPTVGAVEDVEDILQQLMTTFRFGFQLCRFISLTLLQKRKRMPHDDIDFSMCRVDGGL
eukprot:GHVU01023133.1.p1 GENE.GHVU01023133.1~~GHVU01023133.1.p1  ORF type:complete len:203 (-),score=31.13 GHVU01023133.1:929-1537(-)